MSKITKADLIHEVAKEVGLSKAQTEKSVNALLEGLMGAMSSGRKIALVGFGTFYTTDRAPRQGQDPQTGKKIQIPAARVARFRVGKNLREAVNH